MSRELRSILQTSKEKLKPRAISPEIVHTRLQAYKKVEESYFNRRTKPLEPLELGGSARVQNMQKNNNKNHGNKQSSLITRYVTKSKSAMKPWSHTE